MFFRLGKTCWTYRHRTDVPTGGKQTIRGLVNYGVDLISRAVISDEEMTMNVSRE